MKRPSALTLGVIDVISPCTPALSTETISVTSGPAKVVWTSMLPLASKTSAQIVSVLGGVRWIGGIMFAACYSERTRHLGDSTKYSFDEFGQTTLPSAAG
jgi:hypothetical protein